MKIEEYMMSDVARMESVKRRLGEKTRLNKDTGCVEWVAKSVSNGGYGTLCVGRKGHIRAHRASWVLANGPIPDGTYVCHKCDNPKCTNVYHLFLGTPKDNMDDKKKKGRGSLPPIHKGENHHNSKLTAEDVALIRDSKETLDSISSEFGISTKTAWRIRKRIAWSHI